MTDAATTVPASIAKKTKEIKAKTTKPKVAPTHPSYSDMIKKAILESKDKNGSSKSFLLKYIVTHFKVGENIAKVNAQLRLALKRGVTSGTLKQAKGTGASGSFKLGEKKTVAAKPKTVKPSTTKSSAAKLAKSPKKITKPKAKNSKKPASPKKAKKPVAKKTTKSLKKTKAPKAAKAVKA